MKKNFWKTIFEYSRSYKKRIIISIIFSLLTGVAVALQPLVIKYILDNGIQNEALSANLKIKAAGFYCVIYLGLSLFRIISWAIGYHSMLIGLEGFLFNIRSKFFSHIQTLCMRFYDNTSSGELFNYIMGSPMSNLKNFLLQFCMGVPYKAISLLISLSALFSYDWLLTIIMLVSCTISIFLNRHSRKKIKELSSEYLHTESEASKFIGDMLHGSRAVKMYAIEDDVHNNFEKYINMLRTKGVLLSYTQFFESTKPEFNKYIGISLIYFIGAISCIYRGLSVGELVAFVTSMGIIMESLTLWFDINLIRSNAEASLDRIESILNIQTTTPERSKNIRSIEIEKERAKREHKPCIEFINVSFGYDKKQIFQNLNCYMNYNQSFGLVGSSGSGKSTIIKLIMRLYDVQSGTINIHDRDIKNFSLHELRKSIGIVPQDPFMFQTSIIENIRIACPDASMPEIIKAMEIARVHEFVNELPKGWNTVVGEGGFGISGGQKQRVAIARAILGKPDILIFDEATSALDNVSEKHIQNAMEELMKTHTVIIIAHRLTTVKNVNKILVFDKGEIVQEGTYDELSKKNGLFKEMLEINIDE